MNKEIKKDAAEVENAQNVERGTETAKRPAGPVTYCGPDVRGVAKQFTTYINGLPSALAEAIKAKPVLGGLVVPLEQLPEVRRQFHAGAGHYFNLYRAAQGN